MRYIIGLLLLVGLQTGGSAHGATIVRFETVIGNFDIQMFDTQMPRTVQNFVSYVNADRYDGTVVHRNSDTADPVLRDFVIQGGGYRLHDPDPPNPNANITFSNVTLNPAIADEPGGGVAGPSNLRGTIAMAKSGPNTVTSQWFINQGNNSFLDNPTRPDGGFSAFGMVLGDGMTVVDAIGDLPLPSNFGFSIGSPFNDLPLRNFSGSAINHVRVANTVTVNSISVLSVSAGDFNRDGSVNLADLTIWNTGYGLDTGAFLDDGDADMDGDVDGRDFLLWQRSFGSSAPLTAAVAVPEPAAVTLIAIAMGLAVTRSIWNR